jgi:hypothetical protein
MMGKNGEGMAGISAKGLWGAYANGWIRLGSVSIWVSF